MQWRWFDRQMGATYYTFFEAASVIGLRRLASFIAAILLVALGGATLLVILDALAHAAGGLSNSQAMRLPRALAGLAILGGLFVWDRFASPERVALLTSLYSSQSRERRRQRRLKVAAFVSVVTALCLALAEE